ncbi:MAG: hypothetical protein A2161_06590 [Candidatus Schekmanbacteria bacterium RBG_13_48_7]|uniref:Uncharacterized protein n=1 Tax=Candidatus Schekmanbacteria bacterium RBG_13_48_7 TaxID=1817878 RepID=A0A1F7RTT0_9BACT|nr:MAG: hypothetical protein A2161_06590 [Candidatus Schekmanbacteria bacterium RBG_13_48_7]
MEQTLTWIVGEILVVDSTTAIQTRMVVNPRLNSLCNKGKRLFTVHRYTLIFHEIVIEKFDYLL